MHVIPFSTAVPVGDEVSPFGLEKNAAGSLVIARCRERILSLKAFVCYKSPKTFKILNSYR